MKQYFPSPFTIIAFFLGALLLGSHWVFGFTEPFSFPPADNAAAPLNVSSTGQSKSGGLILNTGGATYGLIVDKGNVGIGTQSPSQKLDVAGYIKAATGICIGGDCRTSWPSSGIGSETDPTVQSWAKTSNPTIPGNLQVDGNFKTQSMSTVRYTNSVTTKSEFEETLDVTVSCGSGGTVLGGGCHIVSLPGSICVGRGQNSSYPTGEGWRCMNKALCGQRTLTAYAICTK